MTLALSVLVLIVTVTLVLARSAAPSLKQFGLSFLATSDWDPPNSIFGALPFIYGTAVSSMVALVLAVPLSLGVALFLNELAPDYLARPFGFTIELLAAIPSVVYGLWAIFVLGPWIRGDFD